MNDYQKGFYAGIQAALQSLNALISAKPVTAPASSDLGVELSKIRDRLNALELMHEGQPAKTAAWEQDVVSRLEYLEQQEKLTLGVFKTVTPDAWTELRQQVDALQARGVPSKHLFDRVEALELFRKRVGEAT